MLARTKWTPMKMQASRPEETTSRLPSGDGVEVDPEAPVVILTHGMPSNGNCKPEMLLMQAFLAEGGINSLSFSLRNYGHSDQVSDYIAVGQVEYVDILGAYDWLIDSKEYQAGEVLSLIHI